MKFKIGNFKIKKKQRNIFFEIFFSQKVICLKSKILKKKKFQKKLYTMKFFFKIFFSQQFIKILKY